MCFRGATSGDTRREIVRLGVNDGIGIDIRDEDYLVTRLGGPSKDIYARYFKDLRTQVDILLNTADPLATASDRVRHAMLATLGAHLLRPEGRLARQTLFDQTVLAALVSTAEPRTADRIQLTLRDLLPEEHLTTARLSSALERIRESGEIGRKV